MCLIIFKPIEDEDGTPLVPDDWIESSLERNKDAVGIMYVENDRVVVDRMLGTKDNKDELIKFCKDYN